jgi:hypothetical protein
MIISSREWAAYGEKERTQASMASVWMSPSDW